MASELRYVNDPYSFKGWSEVRNGTTTPESSISAGDDHDHERELDHNSAPSVSRSTSVASFYCGSVHNPTEEGFCRSGSNIHLTPPQKSNFHSDFGFLANVPLLTPPPPRSGGSSPMPTAPQLPEPQSEMVLIPIPVPFFVPWKQQYQTGPSSVQLPCPCPPPAPTLWEGLRIAQPVAHPNQTFAEGSLCDHYANWRRLRLKKGLNHMVCCRCGLKWKSPLAPEQPRIGPKHTSK